MSSTVDILVKLAPDLSHDELDAICRLSVAINHAIKCAQETPVTLRRHERTLIVMKLQEADHWCLELARIAAK